MLAYRVQEILNKIAATIPDVTRISPDLLDRIDDFTRYTKVMVVYFMYLDIPLQNSG